MTGKPRFLVTVQSHSNEGPPGKGKPGRTGRLGNVLCPAAHPQPLGGRELLKKKSHPNSLEKAVRGTRWHFHTCCLLKGSLSLASPTRLWAGPSLRTHQSRPRGAVGRLSPGRQGAAQAPGLSPLGGKSSHLGSQSGPSLGLGARPLAPTPWRLRLPAEVEVAAPREPLSSDQKAGACSGSCPWPSLLETGAPRLVPPWPLQVLTHRPRRCPVTFLLLP